MYLVVRLINTHISFFILGSKFISPSDKFIIFVSQNVKKVIDGYKKDKLRLIEERKFCCAPEKL